jgi:hypothetical protein
MNNRLKAWIGFKDGNCDDDTQMLIDDIKELEKKLTEAVDLIKSIANLETVNPSHDASVWFASDAIRCRAFLKSLEEKEGKE